MWKENKNVALGVAKENNGSSSNISSSFPPSLGWEEADCTFRGCVVPGVSADQACKLSMESREHFLLITICRRLHCIYFRLYPKSISTALQPWVLSSPPGHPAGGLSNSLGKWHWQLCAGFTPLAENCPKHFGASCFEKTHAVGAVKKLCTTKYSIQLAA